MFVEKPTEMPSNLPIQHNASSSPILTLLQQRRCNSPETETDVFAAVARYSQQLSREITQVQQQWQELQRFSKSKQLQTEPLDPDDIEIYGVYPRKTKQHSEPVLSSMIHNATTAADASAPYEMC